MSHAGSAKRSPSKNRSRVRLALKMLRTRSAVTVCASDGGETTMSSRPLIKWCSLSRTDLAWSAKLASSHDLETNECFIPTLPRKEKVTPRAPKSLMKHPNRIWRGPLPRSSRTTLPGTGAPSRARPGLIRHGQQAVDAPPNPPIQYAKIVACWSRS